MERYKKKNLKFMGKGPEVRAAEMNAARGSVRQQRFSLQRPLEDTDVCQESKKPTLGIPKLQSRLDMLSKWKAEKELKKRLEVNSKKPAFVVGSARPQLDATGLSRLQTLKASRIQPVSKLAAIHHKDENSKPEVKTSVPKTNQAKSIPAVKPQIARLQVNKAKSVPISKPQMVKPQVTKTNMNEPPSSKSSSTHPQTRQYTAKNSSAPSNFKPQSNTGVKPNFKNGSTTTNIKPPSNGVKEMKVSNAFKPSAGRNVNAKEDKKIPTSGIKPSTFLPQRKPPLQNPQNKPKLVSSVQSKKPVKAAVPPPDQDPGVKNQTGSSSDQSSLFPSCQLSVIKPEVPLEEKSFAPSDFVFCPPKLRSSWLEDEGPYTILNRVMKEMKLRTSTPIKDELVKHQEMENSNKSDISIGEKNTRENVDMKESGSSSIPNSDTKYIEALIHSPAVKLPELKDVFTFSFVDKVEDAKAASAKVSPVENQELVSDVSPVSEKEEEEPLLPEKENRELVSDICSPVKEVAEAVENLKLETLSEIRLRSDHQNPLGELTDNIQSPVRKPQETLNEKKAAPPAIIESKNETSVFYPPEPSVIAPERSTRRLASNFWKKGKPSLALISESPERNLETPKSHRRKALLKEEFIPRRSPRLSRMSVLKCEEEDIFNVKECYLDSPSAEAASRMSMCYDFDRLHLEASASQAKSNGHQSSSANRGKVSLLYTPPRTRASTRLKSLKGDLMTFSPNVE